MATKVVYYFFYITIYSSFQFLYLHLSCLLFHHNNCLNLPGIIISPSFILSFHYHLYRSFIIIYPSPFISTYPLFPSSSISSFHHYLSPPSIIIYPLLPSSLIPTFHHHLSPNSVITSPHHPSGSWLMKHFHWL